MRLSTAAYIAITIHFLRGIARKSLSPYRKPRNPRRNPGRSIFVSRQEPGYPNIVVAITDNNDFGIVSSLANAIDKELYRRDILLQCYMLTDNDTAHDLGDGSYSIPYTDHEIRSAVIAATSRLPYPVYVL